MWPFLINFEDLNMPNTVLDSGDVERSKMLIRYLLSTCGHCVVVIALCELTHHQDKSVTKSQCGVRGQRKRETEYVKGAPDLDWQHQ